MRGCAGAGSTQARTPTCRSPPLLATLIVFPFSYLMLFTCLDQTGANFGWVWLGASFCRPASLEPVGPVQARRVHGLDLGLARGCLLPAWLSWVWLKASSLGPAMQALSRLDLSRPDRCKVRSWVWLEASSFLQL